MCICYHRFCMSHAGYYPSWCSWVQFLHIDRAKTRFSFCMALNAPKWFCRIVLRERQERLEAIPLTLTLSLSFPLLFASCHLTYSTRQNNGKVRHKRQALQDMARPLKQWLYKHRDNPYPTKTEKILLALGSQMTLVQVRTSRISLYNCGFVPLYWMAVG